MAQAFCDDVDDDFTLLLVHALFHLHSCLVVILPVILFKVAKCDLANVHYDSCILVHKDMF